eukprot:TRINITY_DN28024_c0_g1_i1.p1 TRINITY_DN28024_c0_g1~~TRINITY_DN28024_c0_g1_i1.p1  ORF type:complete len:575 (-),score=79.81 TRINITY_DN28024_c0_g1_i1:559-2238(-)
MRHWLRLQPGCVFGRARSIHTEVKDVPRPLVPTTAKLSARGQRAAQRKALAVQVHPPHAVQPHHGAGVNVFTRTVSHKLLSCVIKVYVVSSSPNYLQPWQRKNHSNSTGSGFVIDVEKRLIITNAHVTMDGTFVEVRKHGSPDKFQAQVVYVGHACDLALLTVLDEGFWQDLPSEPLSMVNALPDLQDEVRVVGYPTGGDQISITAGVVSRIEQQQYSHALLSPHLLSIQIDAAINPGNSGGPAMLGDKVVGVAFQALMSAENIGFIIPTVIIKHFMGTFEGQYDKSKPKTPQYFPGFCSVGIHCTDLGNKHYRSFLKMGDNDTGVVVYDVRPISPAFGKLQTMDVLLQIDGQQIANDGSVRFRGNERLKFEHLIQLKKQGEAVRFTVLRNGERLEVDVPAELTPLLVPNHNESGVSPYVVLGGFVFTRLSMGYLLEWGDWWNNAPRRLSLLAAYEKVKVTGEEAIVLSSILMHTINQGYNVQEYMDQRVVAINGTPIRNLCHLLECFNANTQEFVRFELADGRMIVLNYEAAKAHNDEILAKYGVPAPTSPDLAPRAA